MPHPAARLEAALTAQFAGFATEARSQADDGCTVHLAVPLLRQGTLMKLSLTNLRFFHLRRTAVASAGVTALLAGSLLGTTPAQALDAGCEQVDSTVTCTFNYTASTQSWTVPEGVGDR
jgi:hypothetical protein